MILNGRICPSERKMSKIFIDEDILNRAIDALNLGMEYVEKIDPLILATASDDLIEAKRISKEKHFSVLEWHPVSENPNKDNDLVIVKLKNGEVSDFVNFYDLPDDEADEVAEWAYPPQ